MNKNHEPAVYVVDDDAAVRDSLGFLFSSVDLKHHTFASAQDFLTAFQPDLAGCLVLDIRMPGMSGLELQEELNTRGSTLPVIFITGHGDVPMAVEAMRHGALDFIQKPFRDQELLDRVNTALDTNKRVRTDNLETSQLRKRYESLTSREKEVFAKVANGKANKVIAYELGVSQRTVEIHRSHVMEKMAARSLANLVKMQIKLMRN
ncbi:MAG: response regulator transcription factor [Gammaproteobacteria bacterium]|nr:response regulator transcription factor [Gammaproteobacteria bacterium]